MLFSFLFPCSDSPDAFRLLPERIVDILNQASSRRGNSTAVGCYLRAPVQIFVEIVTLGILEHRFVSIIFIFYGVKILINDEEIIPSIDHHATMPLGSQSPRDYATQLPWPREANSIIAQTSRNCLPHNYEKEHHIVHCISLFGNFCGTVVHIYYLSVSHKVNNRSWSIIECTEAAFPSCFAIYSIRHLSAL